MWWVGTEARRLEILLGRTGWSACRNGSLIHAEVALPESDVLQSLVRWLDTDSTGRWWRPDRATIYLSGSICRPFLLPALLPLSPTERKIAIDAAAKARTGFSEPVQVWLSPVLDDELNACKPHQLGAALPLRQLGEVVVAIRKRRGVRLVSIQPLWALALRVALSSENKGFVTPDVLLVRDADSMTVLAGMNGEGTELANRRDGFAAALTVDASQDATHQRNAIMRVISGLELEPKRSVQFEIGTENPDGAARVPIAPSLDAPAQTEASPLAGLWALRPFDLGSL